MFQQVDGRLSLFLNLSLTCLHFETQFATLQGLVGIRDISLFPVWKQLRGYINSYHFFPQPPLVSFALHSFFYSHLTIIVGMMLHQSPPTKQVLLYKTEYCRNWTELGYCRHVNDV